MTIHTYDAYLFDLDGVVWLGTEPIPGVAEAINSLKAARKNIRFITNNAGQHRSVQCEKLVRMGVHAEAAEVITSGYATAQVIKRTFGATSVHVMGTDDLRREMTDAGHQIVDEKPSVVVVGFDREFSWQKLDTAFNAIHYHGSRFIACNEDRTYPEHVRQRPGTGTMVAALAHCVGFPPEMVVGKPHRPIMEIALESLGLSAERCLMTGDKIETDILAAHEMGMATAFALSGVGKRSDLESSPCIPTFVLSSAAELRIS